MATMFVPTSRRGLLPAFLLALIAGAARATPFTVAPVFGSGMVLQRAPAKSAVYGTSEPGDTVTIKVTPAAGGAISHLIYAKSISSQFNRTLIITCVQSTSLLTNTF